MSTTTDVRNGSPRRRTVLWISLAVQVGLFALLWFAAPLRTSSMSVNPEEVKLRAAEVEKREKQRLEEERKRREKVALKEEDAETLRKKAEAKEVRRVAKKVREMREIKERINTERDLSLTRLAERSLDDINSARITDLLSLAEAVVEASGHLQVRSQLPLAQSTRPACVALRDATAAYLEGNEWKDTRTLSSLALDIRDSLQQKITLIKDEAITDEQEREKYGLFVHDSNGVVTRVDEYLAQLEQILTTEAELAAVNDLSGVPSETPSDGQADPESMSLDELVAEAAALEQTTAQSFAEMRASEMAQIEGSSFDSAMAKITQAMAGAASSKSGQANETASVQADSAPVGESSSGPSTIKDLQNFRDAQAAKTQQVTGNWVKAMNMGQQAAAAGSQNQVGRSATAFQASKAGSPQGQGSGNSQGAAGKRGGDSSKTSRNRSGGGGTAFRSQSRTDLDATAGLRSKVPVSTIKAKALPGRRFRNDSTRQGWLFIDTWYVIGPWENHGQLNYEIAHPPEVTIDLDAEYSDGKPIAPNSDKRHPLKWQFVQSDIMRITPPNEQARSTYYAYTEVYFEEAAEMLVAIATDDAARMWVNDKLVWEDQGQSAWNLDEGFRVIRFKKGFNKFLARIENSPTLCEFSVLLCPPDQISK
ncbi:hypothetical protein [Haloferula sp.]|uniref:hypothetical protein n=1 Tax=Haloferula sp. TaxID=2497595 RepID=UPI003C7885E0